MLIFYPIWQLSLSLYLKRHDLKAAAVHQICTTCYDFLKCLLFAQIFLRKHSISIVPWKIVLAHFNFLFLFVGRSLMIVCLQQGEKKENLLNFTVYVGLILLRMGPNGNVLCNLNGSKNAKYWPTSRNNGSVFVTTGNRIRKTLKLCKRIAIKLFWLQVSKDLSPEETSQISLHFAANVHKWIL